MAADPLAQVTMLADDDQVDFRGAASKAAAIGYVVKQNLLQFVALLRD